MGVIRNPEVVQFFTSIIFKADERLREAEEKVRQAMGDIEERTEPVSFYQTNYYEKEMGDSLSRLFLLFQPAAGREHLPEVKLRTNAIEADLSSNGKRTVNIDPGYISLENIVLATTKGYSHRVYLGNGIYADLTLIYQNSTYRPLQWTYPDYADQESIAVFNRWRARLKEKIKAIPISDQR